MATLLMNAHNVISGCCGPAGNIFAKVFNKDEEEDQTSPAPTAAATSTAPTTGNHSPLTAKKFGFTNKDAKYEDVKWGKMPLSARKAAKVIRFDEASWNEASWLEIDDKHWHDLTEEEKKAVETLGWDEMAWDHKYEHTSFDDMPKHAQKAATKLGWDAEKWDGDWDMSVWEKGWGDMTDEEKRCLHVLGYMKSTWD